MTRSIFGIAVTIVLLAGATPGRSQQSYLYAPTAVAAGETVQKTDGVLVQEVSVKKGDTLYGISRTFSGHGMYYPQILLFNDIKDPNRIYPGNVLKIPVSRSGVTGQVANPQLQSRILDTPPTGLAAEIPASDLKKGAAVEEKKRDLKHKAVVPAITQAKSTKQPAAVVAATAEQKQFERALKTYRQEDYRTAVELFDRFLADYPSSVLAADASLYKAESYLKQSNQ
jgi:LysM repeat protein